jgi:hypothetical protein
MGRIVPFVFEASTRIRTGSEACGGSGLAALERANAATAARANFEARLGAFIGLPFSD